MANNTGVFFNINDNDGIPLVGVSTDGRVLINHLYGNCLIGSTSSTGTVSQPLQVTGGAYVSGNTGIGTTNPQAKLDVNGSAYVSGNTGIGTTNPQAKLDVNGGVKIFKDNGSDILNLTRNTSGGGTDVGFKFNVDNPSANSTTLGIYRIAGNTSILNITDQGQVYPNADNLVDIGDSTKRWRTTYAVTGDFEQLNVGTHSIVSITTSHTASAGTPFTIDTFSIYANDLAEYTIHVGYGTYIQAQKVLVMYDGTTAYFQEYAIMYEPNQIVSIGATVSAGVFKLQATPESGISGITTYRIVRGGIL